uniref:PDEase domain-containing protein n=1 Tax=Anisakis simplex TaxID=6269 RepID=A0A0M3JKG5_ANISI
LMSDSRNDEISTRMLIRRMAIVTAIAPQQADIRFVMDVVPILVRVLRKCIAISRNNDRESMRKRMQKFWMKNRRLRKIDV